MGKISEIERENRNRLFKLMAENPELPVVAMVDTEVVADDDYGRWMGSWGCVFVDEYIIETDNPIIFKRDDVYDTLERILTVEEFDALPDSDEECRKIYNKLPWVKAIIVNIDLPENVENK